MNSSRYTIHIVSEDHGGRTRGCKWAFEKRPHKWIELDDVQKMQYGTTCSVCIPAEKSSAEPEEVMGEDSDSSEDSIGECDAFQLDP